MNTNNQTITRQQTVIIAANEKESIIYGNKATRGGANAVSNKSGYFEVILNKGVVINNGDVVSVKSCFIDTTKIDVEQINVAEDVVVNYTNGIYVKNQQLETFFANKVNAIGDLLTDNKNYTLCYVQPAQGGAAVLHYNRATARSWGGLNNTGGEWGNLHYQLAYQDSTGNNMRAACFIPQQPGSIPFAPSKSVDYPIDFVGSARFAPRPVDPVTGKVLQPSASFPNQGFRVYGYVRQPADNIQFTAAIEDDMIFPVLNRGSFTIPKGEYQPTHLAQVITDLMSALPDSRDKQSVIEPTAPFFLTLETVQPPNYPTAADVSPWTLDGFVIGNFSETSLVIKISEFGSLPFPYTPGVGSTGILSTGGPSQLYKGWTLAISYFAEVGGVATLIQAVRSILTVGQVDTDPALSEPILYTNRLVFGSVPTDGTNPVIEILDPPPLQSDATDFHMPTVILNPPPGQVDGGSCFLQSSLNYQAKLIESGQNAFCFVDSNEDVEEPNQLLTFDVDSVDPQIFGSNQVALIYDPILKRFKFDQIHYAATNGDAEAGTTPAVIKQTLISVGAYATDPVPATPFYFATRTYGDSEGTGYPPTGIENEASVNVITTSIGGIFFHDITSEPPNFFSDVLGFELLGDNSILASIGINTYAQVDGARPEYNGWNFDTNNVNVQSAGQIVSARPTAEYGRLALPFIKLVEGKNITAQSRSIGDATGTVLNYTAEIGYSETAIPSNNDGRVSVQDDAITSIIASASAGVGVQDSGYYIVDVEIGMQYNEFISSSQNQQGFSRNIRMIVDRYYSANAYVSSEGDGVEYIHYGNPTTINSVKVRIYNSNGDDILQLGDDNSVFLKVMKTVQINIAPLIAAQEQEEANAQKQQKK